MSDDSNDMAESAQSPTITIKTTYRTRDGEKTEEWEIDNYEVENLLELALRDSLEGVDARVLANEFEARSR